ncbi:hypothetical protein ACFOY2_14180 [Nonomuraea purpurea]|uniref:Uncharacterized protein n=1 Tax=Nonomuraea purpurea TaxID=1849276 RepID=A0ABV8G2Z1_9ACTN
MGRVRTRGLPAVALLAVPLTGLPAAADSAPVGVTLSAETTTLPLDGTTSLKVEGRNADGTPADLTGASDSGGAVTFSGGVTSRNVEGGASTARSSCATP